jgi:hypothetical protein
VRACSWLVLHSVVYDCFFFFNRQPYLYYLPGKKEGWGNIMKPAPKRDANDFPLNQEIQGFIDGVVEAVRHQLKGNYMFVRI